MALAALVRWGLDPWLGEYLPYPTFFVAIAIVAWLTTTTATIVTIIAGWLLADSLFISPRGTLHVMSGDPRYLFILLAYFIVGLALLGTSMAMRRAQRHDAEGRERLRTTLASIGDAVIATDIDGRVTMMNAVAEQLSGWTIEDVRGRPLTEVLRIVNEMTRQTVENPCDRALREGVIVGLANHTVLIAKDGTEYPIDDSAAPIRCADGEIVGCVLIFRDVTERRRTEQKLRESEKRKAALIRASIDCIIKIDHEGRITDFNPAAERIFGYRHDDVLGKPMADLIIPPSMRERHQQGMAHYLATGEGPILDKRLDITALRADGSEFPVELTVTRIPVDGPPLFAAFLRDLTDSARAEQRLRASEQALAEAQRIAHVGSWEWDAATDRNVVSEELCRIFGLPIGQPIPDFKDQDGLLYPHESWMRLNVAVEQALRTGEGYELDLPALRNGEQIWITTRSEVVRDHAGNVVRLRGTVQEITARKREEEEIGRQAAVIQAINDNTADLIFMKDLQGRLIYGNAATWRIVGRSDAATGSADRDLFSVPAEHAPIAEHDRLVLETGRTIQVEEPFTSQDGTHRVFLSTKTPLRDSSGSIIGVIGVSRDITELKQNQEALRKAKEAAEAASIAKDNFIATLSHELRTPLTPVLATLTAWENDIIAFPSTMREDLAMVRRNVDLEARLIDDLLDLTRIVKGKIALNLEVLNVETVVDAVVNICKSDIHIKKLDLSVRREADECYVRADAARLQQAIWNLLRNAVKFTPENGRIELVTRKDARGDVQIIITDTGIGIDADTIHKLFTPFEQGDADAVKKYGGLGLGLAITRTLLSAQGGAVEAKSEGRGRGASFIITLPCVEAARRTMPSLALAAPVLAATDSPEDKDKCFRVLLVEDHGDTLRVLARLLRAKGHEVSTAQTVADAIVAARTGEFHVLVSDLGLPDGTGTELLRQLRHEHGLDLPAIALTGFGMEEDVARCKKAGFNDHLTKPVNVIKLQQSIQRACAGEEGIECAD